MFLLGTNLYPAKGDAARRQGEAAAAMARVSQVPPINLQFAERPQVARFEGFETQCVLQQDSTTVAGAAGARKPIASEIFTRLAEAAHARGCRYFGFANSDIVATPQAVERVVCGDQRCFVFSRTEVDPLTGADGAVMIYGADLFVVEASWWLTNRRRFRPYIVGEACWDNVYAAQLLHLTGGRILNRKPLIRHVSHPAAWRESPFAEHNGRLAALDRPYFTRWCVYIDRLERLRKAAGGLADEAGEFDAEREAFHDWRPGIASRMLQGLRIVKRRAACWGRR